MATNSQTVRSEPGARFTFGRNWKRFLEVLSEERIREAEKSLRDMLEMENLEGRTFLDAGSGSGLFSLAAMRLGAARVHSFDFDAGCVECTRELKRRYFPDSVSWTIESGSVLDPPYLAGLGQFDIVYCWGVLHYCGDMWQGLENILLLVAFKGKLFVAVFNDQGVKSRRWEKIKRLYHRGGISRCMVGVGAMAYFILGALAVDLWNLRSPFRRYRDYKRSRGMSMVHDWLGWLGGYPWQFAKPDAVFEYVRRRGFSLFKLKTVGGKSGNNQFVFVRETGRGS